MKFKTEKNNISYLGSNFQEWFGDMEFEKSEATLMSKKLPRYMTDKEILEELKPDTLTLEEIYAHLKIADKNDWMIFYCKDKDGVLRAVRAGWSGVGWDVDARSVLGSGRWFGGDQVFFRNSVPSKTLAPETLSSSDPLSLIQRIEALEAYKEKVEKVIKMLL